jgi:hypothetical protein
MTTDTVPVAHQHDHTLTVLESGVTFITEHQADPGFTLLTRCHQVKVAHRAFEHDPIHVRERDGYTPLPGVYRIGIADDGNLDIFGRITNEQEPHA